MRNRTYAMLAALTVLVIGSAIVAVTALAVLAANRPAADVGPAADVRAAQPEGTHDGTPGQTLLFSSGEYDPAGYVTDYRLKWLDLAAGTITVPDGLPEGNLFEPRLSPDGTRLLFVTSSVLMGLNDGDLYMMNSDGSSVRNLTPDDPRGAGGAVWSPDGTRIAYLSVEDSALHVLNLTDGSSGTLAENVSGAMWSPDGTALVYWQFASGDTLDSDVFVVAADGSGDPVNVSSLPGGANRDAGWTPDGRVIFTSLRSGNWDIFTVNRDGSDLRNLTPDTPAANERYAYSPDGRLLAYTSLQMSDQGERNIWLMPAEGGTAQMISDDPANGQADNPTWSPDGSQLAFGWQVNGTWNVHVYDVASGTLRNLSAGIGLEGPIAWSPDGSQIAFMGKVDDTTGFFDAEIYLAPADGSTAPVNVSQDPDAYDMLPMWLP